MRYKGNSFSLLSLKYLIYILDISRKGGKVLTLKPFLVPTTKDIYIFISFQFLNIYFLEILKYIFKNFKRISS
jgi:hypothetical protein